MRPFVKGHHKNFFTQKGPLQNGAGRKLPDYTADRYSCMDW